MFVPSDATECYQCVEAAAKINGPVFIRTARLPSPVYEARPFEVGKGTVIKDGKDCVIFTCGIMLEHCLEAVQILADKGIDAALVSFHTLKPFDDDLARAYAAKCGKVFTVEEHSVIGGLGDAVASALCGTGQLHLPEDRHQRRVWPVRQARRSAGGVRPDRCADRAEDSGRLIGASRPKELNVSFGLFPYQNSPPR